MGAKAVGGKMKGCTFRHNVKHINMHVDGFGMFAVHPEPLRVSSEGHELVTRNLYLAFSHRLCGLWLCGLLRGRGAHWGSGVGLGTRPPVDPEQPFHRATPIGGRHGGDRRQLGRRKTLSCFYLEGVFICFGALLEVLCRLVGAQAHVPGVISERSGLRPAPSGPGVVGRPRLLRAGIGRSFTHPFL